ncbi:MAG: hypothetical protein ACTSSK_08970 [Candidatus Heimdallarchaeota archaeon]
MIQSVIISEEAYKQMFQYVIEFAHPDRPYRQWREVIGWLVGSVDEETITVHQARNDRLLNYPTNCGRSRKN